MRKIHRQVVATISKFSPQIFETYLAMFEIFGCARNCGKKFQKLSQDALAVLSIIAVDKTGMSSKSLCYLALSLLYPNIPHGTQDNPHGTHIPTVLNTPHSTQDIPHIYHESPHSTQDIPQGTHDVSHGTHDIPHGTKHPHDTEHPHGTEHPPTVLHTHYTGWYSQGMTYKLGVSYNKTTLFCNRE